MTTTTPTAAPSSGGPYRSEATSAPSPRADSGGRAIHRAALAADGGILDRESLHHGVPPRHGRHAERTGDPRDGATGHPGGGPCSSLLAAYADTSTRVPDSLAGGLGVFRIARAGTGHPRPLLCARGDQKSGADDGHREGAANRLFIVTPPIVQRSGDTRTSPEVRSTAAFIALRRVPTSSVRARRSEMETGCR